VVFLTLAALGCGRGDVTGKVTLNDKPVPFGTVLFEGSDGNIHQGQIELDGSYSIPGVAVGEARAAVNSPNPRSSDLTPISKTGKKPILHPDVPGWFAIPDKYSSPDTSELKYTIKGGQNTINIELK
jgi:hypothetical protein